VRLRTLLQTADLGLTLLVGAGATDRTIDRVFTATLRDPRRFLQGGELVLSGMEWWRQPADSEAFVAALAEAGVAALGAGTAELGGDMPQHVIDACERHGVPLFLVPVDISFATISERVILGLAAERATPGIDRHRRLVAAATAGGGLDALVAVGAAEVGAGCWMLNAAGRLLAGTAEGLPDKQKLARRYLRAEQFPVVAAGATVFVAGGRTNRATNWFLVVAGDYRGWPADRREVAEELATLAGLERSRLDEARRVENRAAEPLLRLLLSEHAPHNEIRSRLAATNLTGPETVVVSAAATTGAAAVLDELLSSFAGPAVVGVCGDEVFGLLDTAEPVAVELKDLARAIEPALGSAGLALGIGRSRDISGLRTAVLQSRYARKLAERSSGRVTVMAGDEVASHLLLLAAVPDELRRSFRDQVLGPLETYDAAHRSELMLTLRVFLEHAGSWTQAATALHVHVNTLRYRIGRIEELTGRDLNRFPDRVEVYLALAASESGR
jgi:DNA-binding PucR family transcriptional regulator